MSTLETATAREWQAELVDLAARFACRDLPDLTDQERDRMRFLFLLLSPTGHPADMLDVTEDDQP